MLYTLSQPGALEGHHSEASSPGTKRVSPLLLPSKMFLSKLSLQKYLQLVWGEKQPLYSREAPTHQGLKASIIILGHTCHVLPNVSYQEGHVTPLVILPQMHNPNLIMRTRMNPNSETLYKTTGVYYVGFTGYPASDLKEIKER